MLLIFASLVEFCKKYDGKKAFCEISTEELGKIGMISFCSELLIEHGIKSSKGEEEREKEGVEEGEKKRK